MYPGSEVVAGSYYKYNDTAEPFAKNIQKMKEKYGSGKLSNFDMDAFMSDQQDLIANILRERSVDLMKNVE